MKDQANRLREIVSKVNNDNIKAVFCGHTHGASISYLNENKPQICASSGLIGFVNNITIK